MIPSYIVVQRFLKIEALGTWGSQHGTPSDPSDIIAYVTPSSDLRTKIELRDTRIAQDKAFLFRVALGNWAMKLTPELYTPGLSYTISFKFWATPSNVNVVRQTFVWDPVSELPHLENHCIVFGTLQDVGGLPVSGQDLVVEQYKNLVTLNERESQSTIRTNAFGLWSVELPIGSIVRIVFGNVSKVILVPDKSRVGLNEIEEYQPAAAQRDRFGYPYPIGA